MSVADWFKTICTNIQVTKTDTISTRYNAITKRLNSDFRDTSSSTANSLYVGSFGRSTAIDGFSDLDMIYVLPYAVYAQYDAYSGNGQSALLQSVKKSIEKTYSSTSIRGDGQVIQVPFNDGITFEVVPAFNNDDGSFTFPNANNGGEWKTTNPKPEIRAIRERNLACNNNLLRLCRLTRVWKSHVNLSMGGLLIDTLAYQFIDTWGYKDKSYLYYDFMCRDFFLFLSERNKDQTWWNAPGSGQYVYGSGFQYKSKQAYNVALKAIEHQTASPSRDWSAKQQWRLLFGTKFPV